MINSFDYVIPFGDDCKLCNAIMNSNLRTVALPFDWTTNTDGIDCFDGYLQKTLALHLF